MRDIEKKEYRIYLDGDKWCATANDFVNLQVSLVGFGTTPTGALGDLRDAEIAKETKRIAETNRYWKCSNCMKEFTARSFRIPECPRCKAGNQYVYEGGAGE